jgi:predicted CoA-substrate-specific enzyme activase
VIEALSGWDWATVSGAAVTGRLGRQVAVLRVPPKQAQAKGYRLLTRDEGPVTLVSIGSHGFSVLELRRADNEVFRENSRCSQGTGNFLRQLVERFDLTLPEADELCGPEVKAAPLSGRCPVILKTDMTHLANKGESRASILAGLYDAVCENVQVLIKPKLAPPRVALLGGLVTAERIRENFRQFLEREAMELVTLEGDDGLFMEAFGAAAVALERGGGAPLPALAELIREPERQTLELVPALRSSMDRVRRMSRDQAALFAPDDVRDVILGFDIGSTGSKIVVLDQLSREPIWEGYLNTNGNPVGAAQALMRKYVEGPAGRHRVTTVGVTGSGREVVGSLMSTCYGMHRVYVLNEIAAHAEGALRTDPRVDTIFEIGGQDAKYIRLSRGRVIDAAMNEACSAGTGSFIEEQGKKLGGVRDVVHLNEVALDAEHGVSLGQHCSVFMAEIIDEAVAQGVDQPAIVAGIYDSIIQNYLNRVKGSRTVGDVIFCQGMPFSSDSLAAAVARQTGSEVVVPPSPGTVGALGIALLAAREVYVEDGVEPLDPHRFLGAEVVKKDVFVCKSTQGCGGSGNKCRIDRLTTVVEGTKQKFVWGGSCSLYDRGTRKKKLPDLSPDPFREHEALAWDLTAPARERKNPGRRRVALSDELMLKGLFPFFAIYIEGLGFDLDVQTGADQALLKRGIEEANVPFCAPMQQFHGLVSAMADRRPDFIFIPMIRSIQRVADELHSTVCPIGQGAADMLRWDLGPDVGRRVISPVIDIAEGNLRGELFLRGCRQLARLLGVDDERWVAAHQRAVAVQERFETGALDIGRRALAFCAEHGVLPVVVLGRVYTIYNTVLNSNVPAILREQGAMAIPVDCFPIDDAPVFHGLYWGYAHRNIRAAHAIRRTPGVYGIFCSNYACGPDSFSLHFFSYIMEGKPFAIIETDGHSGDAGTKTRVEAFLHCVRGDLAAANGRGRPNNFKLIELDREGLSEVIRREEVLLIPRMGAGAEVLAAALRGAGVRAEAMPMPDHETVRIGRRYTSGKECVPMVITMGSFLQRLEKDSDTDQHFAIMMPTANGPCRFGVYNLLHKITLERLGWKDRVRLFSPCDENYFEGVGQGFAMLVWAGFNALDFIQEALYDTRPAEEVAGAAQDIHDRYKAELLALMEAQGGTDLSVPRGLLEVTSGELFGVTDVVRRAAEALARVKDSAKLLPTVLVVGEIYVRCDPFSNDFVIDKLEERGIRCRFAPFNEWIEYVDSLSHQRRAEGREPVQKHPAVAGLTTLVQNRIQSLVYRTMAGPLGWPERITVRDSVRAASPYVREDLNGEAALTLGGPIHEHALGHIDGVVSVGPLECMPNKISEAQFFHVAEEQGLLSLTIPLNGDSIDPEVLDGFAYEVKERYRRRAPRETRRPSWVDTVARRSREVAQDAALGLAAAATRPFVRRRRNGARVERDRNGAGGALT